MQLYRCLEEYKENKTECFLNCVAWRQTGVFISQYFQKGKEIVVEGTLTTRKYQDKDGNNRTVMELIVDQGHFCGKKSDDFYIVCTVFCTSTNAADTAV